MYHALHRRQGKPPSSPQSNPNGKADPGIGKQSPIKVIRPHQGDELS